MWEIIAGPRGRRHKVTGHPWISYKDAFELCLGRVPTWQDYARYELWRVGNGGKRGWPVKWSTRVDLNNSRPTRLTLRRKEGALPEKVYKPRGGPRP